MSSPRELGAAAPTTPSAVPLAPTRTRRRRVSETRAAWEGPVPVHHTILKVAFILVIVALVVTPLWTVVVTSLSDAKAISDAGGLVIIPRGVSFEAYAQVLSGGSVPRSLGISLFITTVGTIGSTLVTALAAYGLSRPGTFLHRPLLMIILFTYLFGPSMIPVYLTVESLGMIDHFSSLIIPSMVGAFNLIILRTFFMGLPTELIDSARIDGAGELTILRRIVLPLSKAPIAVVALFYAVGYWNNFFSALLYINDPQKWPLQLLLRQIVLQGRPIDGVTSAGAEAVQHAAPDVAMQMAVVVIAMVPVLIVYPFIQRHFVKGVVLGAVKG